MRATTTRFSDDLWDTLEAEASRQGISSAQLIREAVLMRVAALAARRGEGGTEESVGLHDGRASEQDQVTATACSDPRRLAALRATGLLDSPRDPVLDRVADTARRVLNAPVALITLVEEERQVLKASPGLKEPWASRGEMPMSHSYCRHAVASGEPLVVSDARSDWRVKGNPALEVIDAVAYLGVPLVTREGHVLGALCVIDRQPRTWTTDQIEILETLAVAVVDHVEARPPKQAVQ